MCMGSHTPRRSVASPSTAPGCIQFQLLHLAHTQTLAQNLFAWSIIPYAGFLYFMTKNPDVPPRMLFGWYFLLVFVVASIPAGIAGFNAYCRRSGDVCRRMPANDVVVKS